MSKIFEWDARKGSFVEGVSKTVMTPTAMTFKRTDKGLAGFFKGTSEYISATNVINSKSIKTVCVWASSRTIQSNNNFFSMGNATAKNRFQFGYSISPGFVCLYNGTSIIRLIESPEINKMYCFILLISDTQVKIIIDNVDYGWTNFTFNDFDSSFIKIGASSTASYLYNGDILKISLHSNTFGTEELNREYKEFLNSQITEKPVRGFELVKPTDLSYLKDTGLVAAYNMKPNGNTLVDISGNGNNGTIVGALRTKDGMSFDGVDDYINCGKNVLTNVNKTQATWAFRINRKAEVSAATIISKYESVDDKRSWNIRELPSGVIGCTFSSNGTLTNLITSGKDLLENNKDLNIVITFNAGQVNFYKNGVLHSTTTSTQTSLHANTTADAIIGYYAAYYNGEISDIRIYNRALSLQEVKAYHNSWIKPEIIEDWSGSAVSDVI